MRNYIDILETTQSHHARMHAVRDLCKKAGYDIYPAYDGESVIADPDVNSITIAEFTKLFHFIKTAYPNTTADYPQGRIIVPCPFKP